MKHDRIDTDSDGIFPIGIKNWEIVHAKNPMLPKDKYHRTNKNLSKTRQLYPAIYSATKDIPMYRKISMDMFPLIGKGRNVVLTYLLLFRWKTIKQDIGSAKQDDKDYKQ